LKNEWQTLADFVFAAARKNAISKWP